MSFESLEVWTVLFFGWINFIMNFNTSLEHDLKIACFAVKHQLKELEKFDVDSCFLPAGK